MSDNEGWEQARPRGRARGRGRSVEKVTTALSKVSLANQPAVPRPTSSSYGDVPGPSGIISRGGRGKPTSSQGRFQDSEEAGSVIKPQKLSKAWATEPAASGVQLASASRPAWGAKPAASGGESSSAARPAWGVTPAANAVSGGDSSAAGPARIAVPAANGGSTSAVGAGDCAIGRGSLRGRRSVHEFDQRIHTRPANLSSKEGKEGRIIRLSANYFVLEEMTDWSLLQYRVDFSPDDERTNVRKNLLKPHANCLGAYIFDGTVLFISRKLPQDPLEVFSMKDDGTKVRITMKRVGELQMGDHHYLQFFNIILRKCLAALNLQLVGRNFFDSMASVAINEHKMELWPGYLTSIRQHEQNIMLCTEISHKVMRQDTALDLLIECQQRHREDWKALFMNAIINSVILTRYNNKTYRIDDVDFGKSPESEFKLKDSSNISYTEYYRSRYDLRISEKRQPLLVSRARPRDVRAGMTGVIYLIPELCALTGLTEEMRANFQLMRALAEHTRVSPTARIAKLRAFSQRLQSVPSIRSELKLWNIKLGHDLVEFNGRILEDETILFGSSRQERAREADWTRAMRGQSLLSICPLTKWCIVYPGKSVTDISAFILALKKSASSLRFNMPDPLNYPLSDDKCQTYVGALDSIMSKDNPDIMMIILPNNRSDRYSAVKKKCCVDRAVPTQVVVAKNTKGKGLMSIATKIAIQISCKIGGVPWGIVLPRMDGGMMVVGYDVCHDTSNKGRSFGAMVASLDKSLSRYYSAASPHTSGEELSNDLSVHILKAVRRYQELNNHLPGRLIIYRDGVGEGQIPFVLNHEVQLIKEKLQRVYGTSPPQICFVIVTKRLNTRIFFQDNNPSPGTVVDSCITSPEKYDFFLVSQSVRQGTVSPTAYNVIYDTSKLTPDRLQRLTYKMTHLYFNWSGTVRVPAQCQYAHKLAFLVGQSLHRPPHQQLSDLLYFL